MDIDIKLNIPALEKLMDYSASGIGSVAVTCPAIFGPADA